MKIYVTGVIFFNGCNEPVKGAFAPDGRAGMPEKGIPPHQASLWIADEYVDSDATTWWTGRAGAVTARQIEGDTVHEFRIMDPAKISFPDLFDPMTCDALDKKLPKLKKKKKATTVDFEVDPDTVQTIARVTIGGGHIEARRFERKIPLVHWTIANPSGLQIVATLQSDDTVVAGIITLNNPEAEIVFANTHDLFADPERKKDILGDDDHVALFQNLHPEADASVFSQKAKNRAPSLTTEEPLLNFMRGIDYTCGDVPPCCPN
jgi:hypothetical protein